MSKPLYKSTTVQAAVGSFVILLVNTGYAMWDGESGNFREPNQAEVAAILLGIGALQGTINGRKKATESIGHVERFEDTPSPSYYIPTEPNYEAVAALPSAEYTWNVEPEKPFAEELDSVDSEENDLDIDLTKLTGKYKLVAKQDSKLKASTEQSNELTGADWLDIKSGQVIEIDSWKFLKEKNSHIQVGIDEYSNINGGIFYVHAPHFELKNLKGGSIEIEAATSPVPLIIKRKSKGFKLPGNTSLFYKEDPIYPGSAFTWGEATKDGTRIPETKEIVNNIIAQAVELDKLRAFNGNKPLVVTSWYRPPAVNAAVNGASNSSHLTGKATDLFCPSMNIYDFQNVVVKFWKVGGVGRGAKNGFCHAANDGWYRIFNY